VSFNTNAASPLTAPSQGSKSILDNLTQPIYERCDSRLPSLKSRLAFIIICESTGESRDGQD
jgi:hypothetical protein